MSYASQVYFISLAYGSLNEWFFMIEQFRTLFFFIVEPFYADLKVMNEISQFHFFRELCPNHLNLDISEFPIPRNI